MFLSIGELLIDFFSESSSKDDLKYSANLGGAPANVAVRTASLNVKSFLYSKVGNDFFGDYLIEKIRSFKVNSEYIFRSNSKTTLAVVSLSETKERSFSFYRNRTADTMMSKKDIEKIDYTKFKVAHFGSLGLVSKNSRDAHYALLKKLKKNKAIITFDPNLRSDLYKNIKDFRETIFEAFDFVEILKISEEEIKYLFPKIPYNDAIKIILRKIPHIFITKGNKGSEYYSKSLYVSANTISVDVVDTTGAGDAFMSGLIYSLFKNDFKLENGSAIKNILNFSNILGALAVTKKGAVSCMPTFEDITNIMRLNK
jgi:fructokinase